MQHTIILSNSQSFSSILCTSGKISTRARKHQISGNEPLWQGSVHALRSRVDKYKQQFFLPQSVYLWLFNDSELYQAYSCLRDIIIISKGAKSCISAALRNKVKCVEPQEMLPRFLLTQRASFLKIHAITLNCINPAPNSIQKPLAVLI